MDGYRDPTAVDQAQHHQSAGTVELGEEGDQILQVSCQLLHHTIADGPRAGLRLADGAAGCFCMQAQLVARQDHILPGKLPVSSACAHQPLASMGDCRWAAPRPDPTLQ